MENKNVSGLSVQLLFLKHHLSWFSRLSGSLYAPLHSWLFTWLSRCRMIMFRLKACQAEWLLFLCGSYAVKHCCQKATNRETIWSIVWAALAIWISVCVCFCTQACWPDGRQTQRSLSFTLIYHLFTNSIAGWLTALWIAYWLFSDQLTLCLLLRLVF